MARAFPSSRTPWNTLERQLIDMRQSDVDWRGGRSALHVYYAGDDVLEVAGKAYAMFMSENALAPAAFPSLALMERGILAARLALLHAPPAADGSFTSGGTESIILAVKTARDWARARRPSLDAATPEIVLPRTAHPAFDKAAHFLNVRAVRVPVGADCRADLPAMKAAITTRSIMIVGSAPSLPYGAVDPIGEIASLAQEHDLWCHVDACIGGFLAPFAKQLGHHIPDFDFAIPGVRSISADIHKYGYAAKGASTVLYARRQDLQYQATEFSDWPKGRYFTPTVLGTRAGGAVAAAWAVLHYLGAEGYLQLATRTMRVWRAYLSGIERLAALKVIGKPDLAVVPFTSRSPDVDIFSVAEALSKRGWYTSRISEPPGIHQMVNLAHEPVFDEYLGDLARVVHAARRQKSRAEAREVVTY